MFANFLLCLHSQTLRSDGRVARQWSAKPSTPVRIRFRPHYFNNGKFKPFFRTIVLKKLLTEN